MKRIIALLLAVVMILGLAACAAKEAPATEAPKAEELAKEEAPKAEEPKKEESAKEEAPAEEVKLTFWVTAGSLAPNEDQIDQEEWLITKKIREYEAANPGLSVEIVFQADPAKTPQVFKAAAMTNDCPDIVQLWTGNNVYDLEELLVDLTPYISAEDRELITSWEPCTVGYGDGAILAYPNGGNNVSGLMYNKEIVAACGLDYENNAPADLDAFIEDLRTIKAAGYCPIYGSDSGYMASYVFGLGVWWPQVSTGKAPFTTGFEKSFSEDEGFVQSMQILADLYAEGLLNEDFASTEDPVAKVMTGEAAFFASYPGRTAVIADTIGAEKIGFLPLPAPENATEKYTMLGGAGSCTAVSKTCENVEAAVGLISYLNSKDVHAELCKAQGVLPTRTDITPAELEIEDGTYLAEMLKYAADCTFWIDNCMNADVLNEFNAYGAQVVTGKMSVEEFTEILDTAAQNAVD